MPTIELGDEYTEDGGVAPEVKEADVEADAETSETGEETAEESSTSETPEESTDSESSEETVETKSSESDDETKELEAIEAIRQEKERLLKEVTDLRSDRRKAREESKEATPLITNKPVDLSDVATQDVELIEKVLRAKGYAPKEEIDRTLYSEKLEAAKDEWLHVHPEYLPENDPDDKKWNALNETISNFFKAPANPRDIKKVLDLAHKQVSPVSLPTKSVASTTAQKEKSAATSKGSSAGGGKSATSSKPKMDVSGLSGFSEDELAELFS